MKPVFATLRQLGHLSSGYIDDSWLMGSVWNDCAKNVVDTVKLLDSLGFVVHPEKSVFILTKKLVFLEFVVDSVSMLVYLTPDKALKVKQAATALFNCLWPPSLPLSNSINVGEVDITLTSDASKQGCSAATGDSSPGGLCMAEEAKGTLIFLKCSLYCLP